MIVFLLLLAFSAPADSTPAPRDSVYTLPVVRVDLERLSSGAGARMRTAFVSELLAGAAGRALETVPELLAGAAGVRVQQYGGLGAFSTVSLRGASPGQVSVLLDGVPLSSAAHGVVSLADLPATAVERIEVYRGVAPLTLGAATPGGAINLVTAASPALRDLHVSRGSFDTWEGRGSAGVARGTLSAFLHAGYQGSAGDFRFDDDNGTPLNPSDDSVSTRVNNRFDAATALAGVTWRPAAGLKVTAREDLFHKAQGLPGLGAAPARTTRLTLLRSVSMLELSLDPASRSHVLPLARVRGALDRERTRLRDLGLAYGGELGGTRHDSDDHIEAQDLAASLEWSRLVPRLELELGGALRSDRARLADPADASADPPQSDRRARGVMAGVTLEPFGEWVVLRAAQRWDRVEDTRAASGAAPALEVAHSLVTPQLGGLARGPLGFEARANWTRATRLPDFLELFGNLGGVMGNPALRPERGESWDAGITWSGGRPALHGAIEWAHFESRTEDLVVYVKNSANSVKAQNFSRARVRGEELGVRAALAGGFSVHGAATWMSALNVGAVPAFWAGKRLPMRPERQSYGRLQWQHGPARAAFEAQFIGDNMLDPSNRLRAPGRTLVGASLGLALHDHYRVTLEGKNLGDRRVSDVGGFPLPGRSVFASIGARFGALSPSSPGD